MRVNGTKVTSSTDLTALYGKSASGSTPVTLYAAKIPAMIKHPKSPVGPQVNTGARVSTTPGFGLAGLLAALGALALGAGRALVRRR